MLKFVMGIVTASLALLASSAGPSGDDQANIKQTAFDYIEGWYDGNAERMERALHPELAKRVLLADPKTQAGRVEQMSAMTLVQKTRNRASDPTPADKRKAEVTVLDVYGNTASVKVEAYEWIDYLHLIKTKGKWVIINVLWEPTPETKKRWGVPENL